MAPVILGKFKVAFLNRVESLDEATRTDYSVFPIAFEQLFATVFKFCRCKFCDYFLFLLIGGHSVCCLLVGGFLLLRYFSGVV